MGFKRTKVKLKDSLSFELSPRDQIQSPFFAKLPTEIRLSIYSYIIPSFGEALHLGRVSLNDQISRTVTTACVVEPCFAEWEEDFYYNRESLGVNHEPCSLNLSSNYLREIQETERLMPRWRAMKSSSTVALMLTCRRAHLEVQHDIYNSSSIILSADSVSLTWALITSLCNTGALSSIRKLIVQVPVDVPLYIQDSRYHAKMPGDFERSRIPLVTIRKAEREWEALWAILAAATNLQSLHVKIYDRRYRLSEDLFLQPLQRLQVPEFTVQLPWPRDYLPALALESDGGFEFKILRPTPQKVRIRPDEPRQYARGSARSSSRGRMDLGIHPYCGIVMVLLCGLPIVLGMGVRKLFESLKKDR